MTVILVATNNPGKLREYKHFFGAVPGVHIVSPNDAEIWQEVAETGETFVDNALLKARAMHSALPAEALTDGWWVLGDDSGLEVDAMDGGPGVHSNRWAGPNTTAEGRNTLILERLKDVPDAGRTARFRCVIALISPGGVEHIVDGTVEGSIAHEPAGSGGFGYDPLFVLTNGKRMSQLTPDEKNLISHRGVAGAKAIDILKREA